MKNDFNVNWSEMNRSHIVYKINFPVKDWHFQSMLLSNIDKSLTGHLYDGAPIDHIMKHHNIKISKNELEQNVKCMKIINDFKRLQIYKYIKCW